jgi:hypothetical protein
LNEGERGSASLESVFAIVMVVVMTLGALQVAFVLYARNVLMSAAHEGVRAAVERGATSEDAEPVAASVVERSAGGLVSDLSVVASTPSEGRLTVHVRGTVEAIGPVPVSIPLSATATAATER